MLEKIRQTIEGKKVLILGFGREGRSSLRLVCKAGGWERLAVSDLREVDPSREAGGNKVELFTGEHYLDRELLDSFDIVFKTPGIVLPEEPKVYRCRFVSQTELFIERFRDQIVGITGTKGKSTTSSLLYHILKETGEDTVLAGNIGIPVFDIAEDIMPGEVIVLELSCHQLEHIQVSPRIAVLLNLYEEHLDHYGTMAKYVRAKQNIYAWQREGDILFCNVDVLPGKEIEGAGKESACVPCRGEIISAVMVPEGEKARGAGDIEVAGNAVRYRGSGLRIPEEGISLFGRHNYFDIGVVYGICKEFSVTDEKFLKALRTFQTLPHRLQYLGVKEGLRFYDDSISTIGETTIQALESVKNVDSILIGGMDRGVDYSQLEEYLTGSSVRHIILMEATGKRIYREIKEKYPTLFASGRLALTEHLEEAVDLARELGEEGGACVLSPAAASYGIFKNFEERGEYFRQYIFGQEGRQAAR